MGFDRAIVIDLVGRIIRVIINYTGSDRLADLDAVLGPLLNPADSNLRRALMLAVLTGAQEAARLAILSMAAASCLPAAGL